MLPVNCLLKQVIKRKIEKGTEVTGREGGRRKQLLGDRTENGGY